MVDSSVTSPVSIAQPFLFNPGDTGAGSLGYTVNFLLDRSIMIAGNGNTLTRVLFQAGSLTVDMFEDSLLINESDPLTVDLAALGLTGSLVLAMCRTTRTAGIDLEGVIDGLITGPAAAQIPAL